MKTFILFFVVLLAAGLSAKAQNLIAVENGGAPAFYTDLPTAIAKAAAGDTLYIPGGTYPAMTLTKQLYLIGVGANPDSTKIGGRTTITGITLSTGSSNGSIVGIYTFGIVVNANLNGFTISRCYIGSFTTGLLNTTNFIIKENIVGNMFLTGQGGVGRHHLLSNNIFWGDSYVGTSCTIKNNLFVSASYLVADSSIIDNNILWPSGEPFIGSNNFFNNNVNAILEGVVMNGVNLYFENGTSNNSGSNNFPTQTALSTIFPTFDSSSINTDKIYEMDFHLPSGSLKNGGADGTDVGIYGGAYPWKTGSIPSNPHFQSITVGPTTDSSGNLKIQINVAAQNN